MTRFDRKKCTHPKPLTKVINVYNKMKNQTWWYRPIILAFGRLRQKDQELSPVLSLQQSSPATLKMQIFEKTLTHKTI